MSLVARGAKLVTMRGAVPVESIQAGDKVLTSHSRFRTVAARIDGTFEGDIVMLDGLEIVPDAALLAYYTRVVRAQEVRPYHVFVGVEMAEWEDGIDRCARGLKMRARGMVVTAPQGAIIMGVSPEAVLGRALLVMRADSRFSALRVSRRPYTGYVGEVILADRELDEVAIYERYAVTAGVASAGANAP